MPNTEIDREIARRARDRRHAQAVGIIVPDATPEPQMIAVPQTLSEQVKTYPLVDLVNLLANADEVIATFSEITLTDRREAWTLYREAYRTELVRRVTEAHEEAHRAAEQRWVERELPRASVQSAEELYALVAQRRLAVRIRRQSRYVSEALLAGKRPGDEAIRKATTLIQMASRELAEEYGLSVTIHSGNRWEIEFAGLPH